MIWLTWRQYRAEAGVAAVLLAAILAALAVIGRGAHHVAQQVGLPACMRSRRRLLERTRTAAPRLPLAAAGHRLADRSAFAGRHVLGGAADLA